MPMLYAKLQIFFFSNLHTAVNSTVTQLTRNESWIYQLTTKCCFFSCNSCRFTDDWNSYFVEYVVNLHAALFKRRDFLSMQCLWFLDFGGRSVKILPGNTLPLPLELSPVSVKLMRCFISTSICDTMLGSASSRATQMNSYWHNFFKDLLFGIH